MRDNADPFTHIASLALRIASLQHEHSSTRRISQDLPSRKPEDDQTTRLPARTPTLSDANSFIRSRTFSPVQSRRNSVASVIPETPHNAVRSGEGSLSPAQPTATALVTSEQLPHSSVSTSSQIDDDMRRRSSLDKMVG